VEADVFGGEIRIVNCGKDLVLEEGRKDRANGCEFVICVSAQMAQDEVPVGRKRSSKWR
jgi:hypothetical protein